MSSYIDGPQCVGLPGGGSIPNDDPVFWVAFTDARLTWLYGPNHKAGRAAMTQRDVAAWQALGSHQGQAA